MKLDFPEGFIWGTSTASAQIETASQHTWKGVQSRTGEIFDRTTDHEKRRPEDLEIIAHTGNAYRLSLDWARLQRSPYGEFHPEVVEEYRDWLKSLKERGIHVMLVLHHFADPKWFAAEGGFSKRKSIDIFLDFSRKMVQHFGEYADSWNTFNEPGGYMMMGYLLGIFPPWKKSYITLRRVLNNMSTAHEGAYDIIKDSYPEAPVGISKHTMVYESESLLGNFSEWWINSFYLGTIPDKFARKADFQGLSYYGRVPLTPMPVSEIDTPGKLQERGVRHDKMWEYHPEGIATIIRQFWKRYGNPIWITENGLCTDDDSFRQESIRDYLKAIHSTIEDGIPVEAYFHWTTWDNFEWFLGPQYRFGLYHTDFKTMERSPKPSAELMSKIARSNSVEV